MLKTVLAKDDNGNFTIKINYETKSDLYSKDYAQWLFKKFHKRQRTLKCGCYPNNDLFLSPTVSSDKKHFFLKKYDKTLNHKEDCPFHDEFENYIDYDNESKIIKYNPKIFQEVKSTKTKNTSNLSIENNIKRYTYYAFCRDLIANSCIFAFNTVNKHNKINNLRNFSFKDFLSAFSKTCINTPVQGIDNIYNFCKLNKGYSFDSGIIHKLDTTLHENLKDDEEVTFKTYPITFNKEDRKYTYNTPKLRKTTAKRYSITLKNLQIFNNFINGPYFYIAINYYGSFSRFFIIPISLTENFYEDYITFVESGFEREYANYLHQNSVPFIKPINQKELLSIKTEKICPLGYKKPFLNSRADFLAFNDNTIEIIEVSGFDNTQYLEQLQSKEKEYKKLILNSPNVTYTHINGKKKEVIKQINFIKLIKNAVYVNDKDFTYDPNWDNQSRTNDSKEWREMYILKLISISYMKDKNYELAIRYAKNELFRRYLK